MLESKYTRFTLIELLVCVAIIAISKLVGFVLKVREDYYDR